MDALTAAFSPCPNDTFVFHAWVHGLVEGAPPVREARLLDIERLNKLALSGEVDVIKMSFHAFAHLRDRWALLHSGGALGRGVGPLLVARKDSHLRPPPGAGRVAALADELARVRIAIPGELTTAALLVGLLVGGLRNTVVLPFDQIMAAVEEGEAEVGAIIHEGRFTYGARRLRRLLDLGEWWEETSGLPLPLGGIAVSRRLPRPVQEQVERAVRESVRQAMLTPDASREYVAAHAQEMDPDVCRSHIDLYVNEHTLDYGEEGVVAIRHLLSAAVATGVAPESGCGVFWDDEGL